MPNRGSKSKYTMAGEEDGGEQVALELIKAFLEEAPSTTLTRAPARCAELVISIPGTRLSNDAVVNAPRQANSEPWNAAAVDTTQWPALGKAAKDSQRFIAQNTTLQQLNLIGNSVRIRFS